MFITNMVCTLSIDILTGDHRDVNVQVDTDHVIPDPAMFRAKHENLNQVMPLFWILLQQPNDQGSYPSQLDLER